jgi:hypothetical protein
VRTPVLVIRSIAVVINAVLGLFSALKKALEMTGRLARIPIRGTSALRYAGSSTVARSRTRYNRRDHLS